MQTVLHSSRMRQRCLQALGISMSCFFLLLALGNLEARPLTAPERAMTTGGTNWCPGTLACQNTTACTYNPNNQLCEQCNTNTPYLGGYNACVVNPMGGPCTYGYPNPPQFCGTFWRAFPTIGTTCPQNCSTQSVNGCGTGDNLGVPSTVTVSPCVNSIDP